MSDLENDSPAKVPIDCEYALSASRLYLLFTTLKSSAELIRLRRWVPSLSQIGVDGPWALPPGELVLNIVEAVE